MNGELPHLLLQTALFFPHHQLRIPIDRLYNLLFSCLEISSETSSNFVAGFGDGASGGITFYLRNWVGQLTETPDVVNRSSGFYSGGEGAGIIASFALHVGEIVQAVRGVRQLGAVAALGKCSFVSGTPVLAKEGQKPIDQLRPGDLVLSRNEQTGEQRYQRVTETFADPKDEIYDLTLIRADGSTETLGVTANHPFWLKDNGWTETDLLKPGDLIQGEDGAWITIKSLAIRAERATGYNLEVAEDHTYFVGGSGAWVHNACPANIAKMMTSQKIAPDLLDKGVHFNVGNIELAAKPNHLGGITFKPVHPGMARNHPALYNNALNEAEGALANPEFRTWLAKHAGAGFEMASQTGSAKALEFQMLLKALGRIK